MHRTKDWGYLPLSNNFNSLWFTLFLVGCFFPGSAGWAGAPGGDLRGVYLKHKAEGRVDRPVGRIALRWVHGGNEEVVRLDHRFRSGDEFRIEISSNREGWLYLLHRQGDGDPRVLWPEQRNGGVSDENRVRAGQSYVIPPNDVIKFDKEAGTEFFYLAIMEERGVPRLTTQGVKEIATKKPKKSGLKEKKDKQTVAKNQLVQIGVRSIAQPPGKGMRAVVFDPGVKDPEHYLYFAAPEGEDAGLTLIEFQLRHE